jgi:glycosyltransferase involved in cell wall biosynthesis
MADSKTSLSVLVPVLNEQYLVAQSLERLKLLDTSPFLSRVEVIVVDDCSDDSTPEVLQRFKADQALDLNSKFDWIFLRHERNLGKGAAIRTALERATCEISVVHDADLEYHPHDLLRIVEVFVQQEADAVFGSRFAGGDVRRVLNYRHQLGNRLLTVLCNLVTNLNLTDIETCYKAVRTRLFNSIPLESNDFRIEVELTIKLAKRYARIYETPISYSGRTYEEGKKIHWQDGYRALWAILKYGLSDNIYKKDEYGSEILARLSRASKYNAWMAENIRGFCGNRVLEIGSGVGNLTRHLIPRRHYVASDINPLYIQTLEALSGGRPYLSVTYCDVTDPKSFPHGEQGFDTVICLNVIEHVEDDRASLSNIKNALVEYGRAIILVPQGPWNFGTLDEVLGHQRRYTKESLRKTAEACGFAVKKIIEFNRMGALAWFFNGRVIRRRRFGLFQIWALNLLTPLFRIIDSILPLPPLSLIAVMEPQGSGAVSSESQPARPAPGSQLVAPPG